MTQPSPEDAAVEVMLNTVDKYENNNMSLLQLEQHNGIVTIFINRPEKRNALNFTLLKELITVAKNIKKNRSIRAVILSGSEHNFSAGIDLSDLNNPKQLGYAAWQLLKPGQSLFQQACLIWQQLPVPVIAALEGYCFGAGLQLALAADIRIAQPATQLSIMESRWGLIPDMGISQSLKGLIRADLAKELTFSARVFDGRYAKEIGLVTHLADEPLLQAQQLAHEMTQRSPDALYSAKQLYNRMQQGQPTLRLEKIWQLKLLLGKNSRLARQKDQHPDTPFVPRQF